MKISLGFCSACKQEIDVPFSMHQQNNPECQKKMFPVNSYATFLETKRIISIPSGIEIPKEEISPVLYDFQHDIVRWALKKGRSAVFADCGLGKSLIQLEWARHVGGTVLIVAPLSINEQTISEGKKLGLTVRTVRGQHHLKPGINITNYEMMRHFIGAKINGIVLDESSIIKSVDGETKKLLLEHFTDIPFRLCCTATPCPNDIAEIANHSQFLGVMTRQEMLASFFVHDQDGWRLRGHAERPFYRWLSSWAMALKSPSDLGYDGSRFVLPELHICDAVVSTTWRNPGHLFAGGLKGISNRASVRKQSASDRVAEVARIANFLSGQIIIWCGLNIEADLVSRAITDSVNLQGNDSQETKTRVIQEFLSGKIRILVTKGKIAGFGMNFQNASSMIFVGLNDSYEMYYQCIRRCWRYGQKRSVYAYVVVTDHEEEIVANVRRKEVEAETLSAKIIQGAREFEMEELGRTKHIETMEEAEFEAQNWKIYQGDCIEKMRQITDESIDLSVFSPPFLALYTYSASEKDLGNSKNDEDFFLHFRFVINELLRITKSGRNACVHVAQVTTTLNKEGVIGLKDFRGRVVEAFVKQDWIYHGEVVIDKDPQAQAIRTHSKGLLFVQLKKDASWLRPALADYILVFRKPGDNQVPITPDISNEDWIEWARPIWYGIKESDTLNTGEAKSNEDDRHICALQLGTIERCIRLWSNPGETVFSPFAGIGSEGYVALQQGRKFIGCELKPLYARTAAKNLKSTENRTVQTLFNLAKPPKS
jgi:DNA modification methylase